MSRANFIEGDPLTDGHVYRFRMTMLCGMLAAWALSARIAGKTLENEDFIFDFVAKHLRDGKLWGESGVPYYVCCLLLLDTHAHGLSAESVAILLIRAITAENMAESSNRKGLANPYTGVEHSVRHLLGIGDPSLEGFAGFSYCIWPLVEYLARNWRRQALASLWRSITRISMLEYKPKTPSEWFRWHSEDGILQNVLPPEPQSWDSLRSTSEALRSDSLPSPLRESLSFLPFYILAYPHRYCSQIQKALEDAVLK